MKVNNKSRTPFRVFLAFWSKVRVNKHEEIRTWKLPSHGIFNDSLLVARVDRPRRVKKKINGLTNMSRKTWRMR